MSTFLALARSAILGGVGAVFVLAAVPAKAEAENHNSSRSNKTFPTAAMGDPVPGVDIELEQIPGGKIFSATTGADGQAVFKALPPGSYKLKVEVSKRVPAHTPEWTDLNEGDPGFTLSAQGNVTVRGWDPKAKGSVAGRATCKPIAIKEEGVQRQAGEEQAGAATSKRMVLSGQSVGWISRADFDAGPVCAMMDVPEGGGDVLFGTSLNSSKSNWN